jgi:hypothetical protein
MDGHGLKGPEWFGTVAHGMITFSVKNERFTVNVKKVIMAVLFGYFHLWLHLETQIFTELSCAPWENIKRFFYF